MKYQIDPEVKVLAVAACAFLIGLLFLCAAPLYAVYKIAELFA
jgi:hypothetical protein